jgi:hypothetical protein
MTYVPPCTALSSAQQGRSIWLFKVSRGDKEPQLVSESVSVKLININEDKPSKKPELHLLIEPSDGDEIQVPIDANMRYTTYTAARAVTFFHKDEGSSYVSMYVLKFPATLKVYSGFVADLKVRHRWL